MLGPWALPVETMAFLAVCMAALAAVLAVGYLIRGITFFGTRTDTEQQVGTAARADIWRWPSAMHQCPESAYGVRTRMKDVGSWDWW